jgi:hypothetical protein
MATPIVSGSLPAADHPSSEPFGTRTLAALARKPVPINLELQARACCLRARECLRAARYAREDGDKPQALVWLKAAHLSRMAATQWRVRRDGGQS